MTFDNSTITAIFAFLMTAVISLAVYIWKTNVKQSEKMEADFGEIKKQLTEVNIKVTSMDTRITKNEEVSKMALDKSIENEALVKEMVSELKSEFKDTRHKIVEVMQSQIAEVVLAIANLKTEISKEYISKGDHQEKCESMKTIVERIDKKLPTRSESISYRD